MHLDLYWLDIHERVSYKLCLLTHRCLLGKAPVYLSHYCTTAPAFSRTSLTGGSVTLAQHVRPSGICCRWPDDRQRSADELCDTTINTTTFRRLLKTHFFSSYLHV